jgi:hypothetical protein
MVEGRPDGPWTTGQRVPILHNPMILKPTSGRPRSFTEWARAHAVAFDAAPRQHAVADLAAAMPELVGDQLRMTSSYMRLACVRRITRKLARSSPIVLKSAAEYADASNCPSTAASCARKPLI